MICSDGLTGMVPEPEIAEILADSGSLDQAARRLIEEANANGGKDNITAVLFRLGESDEEGEEGDTLGDQATEAGLSTHEVREAVRENQATTIVRPAEAEAARQSTTAPSRARPQPTADSRQPTRFRRNVTASIALLVLAAVVVGLYAGSRQFYFLGTNDRGVLTLYRGVPYNLPLGVHLYTRSYASSVPARAVPPRQRDHVLQHKLRTKADASGLMRQLERSYVQK